MNFLNPEPQEQPSKLVEVLRNRGIKAVVFDLDDTLIHTNIIFQRQIRELHQRVYSTFGFNMEAYSADWVKATNKIVTSHGVGPGIWHNIIKEVADIYGHHDFLIENISILHDIYRIVPELREGATELLQTLGDGGIKRGLVTHANEPWSYFKLQTTELDRHLDSITIAHENSQKGPEHWKQSLDNLGLQGFQAISVGDNRTGDVKASREAGYAYQVALPSPWALHAAGTSHEDTIEASGIDDVARALIEALG